MLVCSGAAQSACAGVSGRPCRWELPTPWGDPPQALVLLPALATLRLLGWGLGAGDLTPPPGAQAPPRGPPLAILVLTFPGCPPSPS